MQISQAGQPPLPTVLLAPPRRRSFFVGLCLAVGFLALYTCGLGKSPFFTQEEAREAAVVQEIWTSQRWILPLRNGVFLPSKPPLFHWLGISLSALWGELNEFTIRLPSALLGVVGILVVYTTGIAVWESEAAVIAACILGASVEWMRAATIARVDMVLAVGIEAALCLFLVLYRHARVRFGEAVLFFTLLGLATLTKGPVGIFLPLAVIVTFLLLRGEVRFLWQLRPLTGSVVLLLIAGTWYGSALWQGGEAFFTKQIVQENLLRFVSGQSHKHVWYFFVPALLLGMMPWSFFFPPWLAFLWRQRRVWTGDAILLYLGVWVVVIFAFYSAASSKRAVYLLPLYPALALLLGVWWQPLLQEASRGTLSTSWLLWASGWGSFCVFMLTASLLLAQCLGYDMFTVIWPFLHYKDPGALPSFMELLGEKRGILFVWLGVISLVLLFFLRSLCRQLWGKVFVAILACTLCIFLLVHHILRPAVAKARTLRPFIGRVKQIVADTPLFFYGAIDNGALYYTGRWIPAYNASLVPSGKPYFLLAWEKEWEKLILQGATPVQILAKSEGTGAGGTNHLVLVWVPAGVLLPAHSLTDGDEGGA